jgi:molecular chaperone DnaK
MKAIGIDLGTTNSVVAIDEGREAPRVLPNSIGKSFTPSVVSFSRDKLLVGQSAQNNAVAAPQDTIFSIKRLMGRSFDDKQVTHARKNYPYSIVSADDPNNRGLQVLVNGVKYTPEDISAMILRQVVEEATKVLGEQVSEAVITVPAYFSDSQREATRKAGEQAGLLIKKLIDEPTAAAIAFGVDCPEEEHRLLVFDMGGGTLDVSIVFAADQEFDVESLTGDMWLGGDDFDHAIVQIIIEWVKDNYYIDPSEDKKFLMITRHVAERTKCLLTDENKADVVIPACFSLPSGQAGDVNMTITRSEFEARIQSNVAKGIELVHDAMKLKDLAPEDITTVLLVGGTTYVPLVRQSLAKVFGWDKIKSNVNPMEAVALGAAILAERLQGIACPNCEHLNSYNEKVCKICGASLSTAREVSKIGGVYGITERNLGIAAVDREDRDVFSVLIPAGTPYPLKQPMKRRYNAVGRQIVIPVYAGNKPKASQNEYLGLVKYELPSNVPTTTPVIVQFNYDRNRILKVRIEVEGRPELSYEVIPKRYVPDPNKLGDEEWRTSLVNAISCAETILKKYSEFIESDQQKQLENGMKEAQRILHIQDQANIPETSSKLWQTIEDLKIASGLLLADILLSRWEIDEETAQRLAEQSKSLREVYRAQNFIKVNKFRKILWIEINQAFEKFPAEQKLSGIMGLLHELYQGE